MILNPKYNVSCRFYNIRIMFLLYFGFLFLETTFRSVLIIFWSNLFTYIYTYLLDTYMISFFDFPVIVFTRRQFTDKYNNLCYLLEVGNTFIIIIIIVHLKNSFMSFKLSNFKQLYIIQSDVYLYQACSCIVLVDR